MNTPLAAPTDSSFETPVANTESKKSPAMNIVVELMTVITMWAVVSTFVILLALTWV